MPLCCGLAIWKGGGNKHNTRSSSHYPQISSHYPRIKTTGSSGRTVRFNVGRPVWVLFLVGPMKNKERRKKKSELRGEERTEAKAGRQESSAGDRGKGRADEV